jgi:7,8-dihydro-6-hydroxymethylpterin-pyrophosphokinase
MSLVRAYIALGSNLGNRIGQMQSALKALAEDNQLKVLQISPLYENRACWNGGGR